ncbi:MAG: response regulator, partial [Deltaproteobacteria bacterium]|nr:response regulator [Deltaproteobacteria bacterium]
EFDVVSLDLQMPGMSGIETLKAIKEISPSTEVLIVTAYTGRDAAIEALKSGAYDYIDKPFKSETFREAIRKGVDRRIKARVSDKAQEHLAFVKAQLMQSEKVAALGELIAGEVHE